MVGKNSVVRVAIVGDNSSLLRSLNTSQSKIAKFGKAIAKAGLLVGAAAAVGLTKAVEAAIADEQAQAILADTIKKTTGAGQAQIAMVEDWITVQGQLLGVTDDELRPALGKLLAVTHSIPEAESLASLAMDVSVGRHKELGTVVEALAKARNGSLTGLAKLGVQTKNADGSTRSLNEITKDLEKTYGGLAETAGNTTAGKFQRLKVRMSELGEEIGTKLLPFVNEFGSWLLDEGVPAVEDFARAAEKKLGPVLADLRDWVKDNKDDLKDLAEQIADTVIPAMEKLGGFVGDLVKAFSALPEPIKKAGIQAGIAAGLWIKLNSALKLTSIGPTIAGLGAAKTATKAVGDEAVVTSGKLSKLQGAARNVAGAAGIGLLIDGVTRADGAVSTMETTLGGAAVGFSVGGPWGAAIGGLGGLVVGVGKSIIDGKSDFEEFRDTIGKPIVAHIDSSAVEDLLELLAKAHGNYKLIRDDAALQAAENAAGGAGKLVDVTSLTGLRKDTIASAFAGDPQALALVNDQVVKLTGNIDAGTAILDDFNQSTGKAGKLLPVVGGDTIAIADAVKLAETTIVDLNAAEAAGLITSAQRVEGQKLYNDALADGVFTAQEYGDIQDYNDEISKSVTSNSEKQAAVLQTLTNITGDATAAQDLLNQHNQEGITLLGITAHQLKQLPRDVQTDIGLNGAPETTKQAIGLLGEFGKFLKYRHIKSVISAPGIDLTRKQIEKLAAQAKLTPRQIKTLFKLEGVQAAGKGADNVKGKLKGAADVKPDFTRFKTGLNKFSGDMGPTAQAGGKKVGKAASDGLKQGAKVDLNPFQRGIQNGINNAKSTASTGGTGIGTSLKTGFGGGFAGAILSWSSQVRAAVAAAIAAGKSEARAHSPSKATEETGRDMAEGYVVGSKKGEGDVKKAGENLVKAWFQGAGAAGGLEAINAGLERATGFITKTLEKQLKEQQQAIKKRLDGKAEDKALASLEKRWAKHGKEVTKALKDEYAALRKNGRAQDENAQKLADATEAYTTYSNAIRDTIVASGDISQLGRRDNGTVSLTALLAQLRKRAADAQKFAALLQQLAAMGLNAAQIAQLTAAGPEQALATAQAIASGGQAAVNEINELSTSLFNTGTTLGDALANQFSIAGTNAAQALIKGLEDEQDKLDKAARQMAKELAKEVKKQLGIKSPSKVFMKMGEQTAMGLVEGIDASQIYVNRAGASMASALAAGYAQPQLTANAVAGGQQGVQIEVKLTSQQVSQLERGRSIQLDLDAYRTAGGRSRT